MDASEPVPAYQLAVPAGWEVSSLSADLDVRALQLMPGASAYASLHVTPTHRSRTAGSLEALRREYVRSYGSATIGQSFSPAMRVTIDRQPALVLDHRVAAVGTGAPSRDRVAHFYDGGWA